MKKSNAASVNPTQQSTICPDCPSCWKGYVAHSEGLLTGWQLWSILSASFFIFFAAGSDIGFLFRVATFHVRTTMWQWAGLPLVRLDRCQLKGTIALSCSVKHVKAPNQQIWSVGNPGAFWSSHFFTPYSSAAYRPLNFCLSNRSSTEDGLGQCKPQSVKRIRRTRPKKGERVSELSAICIYML